MAERKYEIMGIEFEVIPEKLGGWHVFNLLKAVKT